jgi:hypothetical protein
MTAPHAPQIPSHVYKYRSLADYEVAPELSNQEVLRRIFVQNEVWFASPATYNDPFDSRVHLEFEPTVPPTVAQRVIADVQREIDSRGVFSVSAKNDDILMWSYYANGHSGICIELEMLQSFFRMVQPISYAEERPLVGMRDHKVRQMEDNLLTKSSMWQHECEWRIFDIKNGPGYRPFAPTLLTGVIFGARISPEDESRVRGWIAEGKSDPKLYRAVVRPKKYGLDIVSA